MEERDIDYMMKCRALFFYSVNVMCGAAISFDDNLKSIFNEFVKKNIRFYNYTLNLMLWFEITPENILKVHEEDEWYPLYDEYMRSLNHGNINTLRRIYADIGDVNVDLISRMAEGFLNYIYEINSSNYVKIKQ